MTDHPALARVPVWVQEKLSPKAVQTIKHVFDWVSYSIDRRNVEEGRFG